uniref:Peptide chain release factor domain-containing protein n=1 Tax=Plectus sambesii TaxID=2011161 RepID=A0A914USD3_9BILA
MIRALLRSTNALSRPYLFSSQRLLSSIDLKTDARARTFFDHVLTQLVAAQAGNLSVPSEQISYWQRIVTLSRQLDEAGEQERELQTLSKENDDAEFRQLAEKDLAACKSDIETLEARLAEAIVVPDENDFLSKCQLEVTCGSGGQESMLFANEIFTLYDSYARFRGWSFGIMQYDTSDMGGLRYGLAAVEGPGAYRALKFEAGVHRVQRVPVTDKSRVHTSTISVAVLPEPEHPEVVLKRSDLTVETMRASGPGGQFVNTTSSAARVTHLPSGVAIHCMESRNQHENVEKAIRRISAILLQRQIDSVHDKVTTARKLQVGTKGRSEKVRTYTYKDDRITDHRIRQSFNRIAEVLQGTEAFDEIVQVRENNCVFVLQTAVGPFSPPFQVAVTL